VDSSPSFWLTAALIAGLTRAARLLHEARYVIALTGAGLSVESGIPPFRGKGGLWTTHGEPPMDGYQRFLRDPRREWEERLTPRAAWAIALRDTLAQAKPNLGHRALAELEAQGKLACTITQNVDGLHRMAGTQKLAEIHGNHTLLRCLGCITRFAPEKLKVDPADLPPRCPQCGGIIKWDTVQFGEPIPADVLRRCYTEIEQADCMLVVGTSATVYPAAEFPHEVLRRKGSVIEVNPEETELTPLATLSLRGPAGALLARISRQG